ncbi:LCP family protein [Nocardiopsis composta]|uniref:LCP family protein required for cell wall assembly n=1 Tax=Nocardiopsis composta TaxID=157465 RepID=A0A7W8QPZ8_9ACTN|nr:LCP family protein [Nocardiopsis composta]MBB5433476.1 LCP family protein required for cell wall assembly [Nocardiopsis composta]
MPDDASRTPRNDGEADDPQSTDSANGGSGTEGTAAPAGEEGAAEQSAAGPQEAAEPEKAEEAAPSGESAEPAEEPGEGSAEAPSAGGPAASSEEPAEDAAASASAAAAAPAAPARRRRRWPRVLAWTAAGLALVLLAGVAGAYGYYRSLRGDMIQHDLDSALAEEDRPEKIGDDVNILFIGSDGREDGNADYGGRDFVGERSDSLMLAHISPDSRVTVVNFPRDSLVQIPQCDAYGETEGTTGYYGMINAALFHGGPPCVVKTIESLTDIRIDHFAHLSFVGFRDMVDAIGGVPMCIPEPMKDERSKLDLDAGEQVLDGEQSLSFVRARYEIGDGGDIGRIDRQQMFLGALAAEATSSDVLADPGKLDGLLRAVSAHTATDRDLTLDAMLSLGSTLADSDLDEISFYTVPWTQAPTDPNRVVWREEDAARLFTAIREDRTVDETGLESDGPEGGGSDEDGEDGEKGDDDRDATPDPASGPAPALAQAGAFTLPVALGDDLEGEDGERIEGRDATANPCEDGLGEGTEDEPPAESRR